MIYQAKRRLIQSFEKSLGVVINTKIIDKK